MTSEELRAWQSSLGFTYVSAAEELGVSRATYGRYLQNDAIPKYIELACKYLSQNPH